MAGRATTLSASGRSRYGAHFRTAPRQTGGQPPLTGEGVRVRPTSRRHGGVPATLYHPTFAGTPPHERSTALPGMACQDSLVDVACPFGGVPAR